jgi:hypothetical protein
MSNETKAEKITYRLEIRDDQVSHSIDCGAEKPDGDSINEEIEEWVEGGEWGNKGASIICRWELYKVDADGEEEEIDSGSHTTEIAPDHSSLIRDVIPRGVESCGNEPDDHEWTSEGEGGLKENPGVWSVGGTAIVVRSHCTCCGLRRMERSTGSQRNPGETDTVEYEWDDELAESNQTEEAK